MSWAAGVRKQKWKNLCLKHSPTTSYIYYQERIWLTFKVRLLVALPRSILISNARFLPRSIQNLTEFFNIYKKCLAEATIASHFIRLCL